MTNDDAIKTFFMKNSQLKDDLIAIGETIDDEDLDFVPLNGIPISWKRFLKELVLRKISHHLINCGLIVSKRKE